MKFKKVTNVKSIKDEVSRNATDHNFKQNTGSNFGIEIGGLSVGANDFEFTAQVFNEFKASIERNETINIEEEEKYKWTIGPHSKSKLYQLIVTGTGYQSYPRIFVAIPTPCTSLVIPVTLRPKYRLLKSINVIHCDNNAPPGNSLTEVRGLSNDINKDFGGKYTFLVPVWTYSPDEAVTGIQIVIDSHANPSLVDMAKGAGGDYRYLLPSYDPGNPVKIGDNIRLLRSDNPSDCAGFNGHTIDINKGRQKTYLYLVWNTVQF